LGTLGRQGSTRVLDHLKDLLNARGTPFISVFMSEIFPKKLELFEDVEAWVQVACPRLSIDWGKAFTSPLLNPYEAEVAFGSQPYLETYPMDYYAKDGGAWSVYHNPNPTPKGAAAKKRPTARPTNSTPSETDLF